VAFLLRLVSEKGGPLPGGFLYCIGKRTGKEKGKEGRKDLGIRVARESGKGVGGNGKRGAYLRVLLPSMASSTPLPEPQERNGRKGKGGEKKKERNVTSVITMIHLKCFFLMKLLTKEKKKKGKKYGISSIKFQPATFFKMAGGRRKEEKGGNRIRLPLSWKKPFSGFFSSRKEWGKKKKRGKGWGLFFQKIFRTNKGGGEKKTPNRFKSSCVGGGFAM